ncbi:MAG TPA: DUF1573 domain-containing protein [Pirellulaceae bacterium]|nr:DUF1573 domain-containing protein [Pirellulaceae bacterium]
MIRHLVTALLLLATTAPGVSAKEWAQKMFKTARHDFGHVAHGSKASFLFEVTNLYEEDVHIADVRTSCGCTTPTITKNTLKSWEKGGILATLNTQSFSGHRNATITVVIDKPYYAEVQLLVTVNIHSDIEFSPGAVSFGNVDQGTAAEKELTVTYYGRNTWQIRDVQSANQSLEVELGDPIKQPDRVSYRMLVRLKDSTPPGYLGDSLTLVTNDSRLPSVSVSIEGQVVSPLTVSPASLFVGVLKPGQTVTKQLVVRAKKPFKITSIDGDTDALTFKTSSESKPVHLVPVTFTAGKEAGEFEQKIEIATDLSGSGKATCVIRGTIETGEASQEKSAASAGTN